MLTKNSTTSIIPYIKIARFDHWFKNIFMLPGIILAFYAVPEQYGTTTLVKIILAFLATGCIASSNYVINELLDAPYDALHPVKKNRPIPAGGINKNFVYAEWIFLALIGLLLSIPLGWPFTFVGLWLWVMGCIYNISPIRSKDKPYIDVLSESVNNPIRLLLGWYATGLTFLPPLSLLLAYWMIGSFFMAIKRFAEYRKIADPKIAAQYRRSFRFYDEKQLLISIMYYAVAFGLFFGIFLIRYKMELILSIPLIAGFMAWYLHLGFLEDSPTQYPERLYKEKNFALYCLLCGTVFCIFLFINIPQLYNLFQITITR